MKVRLSMIRSRIETAALDCGRRPENIQLVAVSKTVPGERLLTAVELGITVFGENYVHISEIDYFVEHVFSGGTPGMGTLAGRVLKKPEPYVKRITENVSTLIKDGDTIQIGNIKMQFYLE